MKVWLSLSVLMVAGLGWLAVDGDARRSSVREARSAVRSVGYEIDGRLAARDVVEGVEAGDPRALSTAGMYHERPEGLYPPAFRRALARKLGPANADKAAEYFRAAAEKDDFWGSMRYWKIAGVPPVDELIELAGRGNYAAFWKAQQSLFEEHCPDLAQVEALYDAAEEQEEMASDVPALREAYRAWYGENCPGESR